MGRLQRKKASVVKKKKTSNDEGTSTDSVSADSSANAPASTASKDSARNKTPGQPKKAQATSKKKSWISRIEFIQTSIQFLREVKAELKKVAWPSRKQALGLTAVVIILVFIISFFLGGVDMLLSFLVRQVFQQ